MVKPSSTRRGKIARVRTRGEAMLNLGLIYASLLAVPATGPAGTPSRVPFTLEDGTLSGMLPCDPQPVSQALPPSNGVTFTMKGFKCAGEAFSATVEYIDYPPSEIDPKLLLDQGRNGAVANIKSGRLVSEQAGSLGGRPGRDVVISAPGVTVRERLLIDRDSRKTRMIMVIYGSTPAEAEHPRAKALFDSLAFKKVAPTR